VKGSVLQLLGTLAEHFPTAMVARSERLLNLFIDALEPQFKKDAPDRKLISGGIKGLSSLLVNLPPALLTGTDNQTLLPLICRLNTLVRCGSHSKDLYIRFTFLGSCGLSENFRIAQRYNNNNNNNNNKTSLTSAASNFFDKICVQPHCK